MSLAVARASSQYAEATSTPLPGVSSVFSMACWYRPTSIAGGTALGVGATGANQYVALGMTGAGAVFLELNGQTALAGTVSSGVWTHLAGVQSTIVSRVAYKDGVAGSVQTVSSDLTSPDRTTIGGLMLNGTRASFAGGDIAECAIWRGIDLTASEVAMLTAGFSPLLVRPASLAFYAPLRGVSATGPEVDLIGALAVTFGAGGASPTISAHPAIRVPPGGSTILVPTAGGAIKDAQAALTGTGSLTGVPNRVRNGVAPLTGAGTVASVASRLRGSTSALTGAGSLTGLASRLRGGVAALTGTGSLSATAVPTTVTTTPTATGWTPASTDVAALMFSRVTGEYNITAPDFTTTTRPTLQQVNTMIGLAVGHMRARVGFNLNEHFYDTARFMATLYTALLLEPGYWPEQSPDKSAWEQWKQLYDDGMPGLLLAIKEYGAGEEVGPDDDRLKPIWAFPATPIRQDW